MNIGRLKESDKRAFKVLGIAGNATSQDFIAVGLSKTRIYNYQRDGLIKDIAYRNDRSYESSNWAWAITPAGRKFAEKNYGYTAITNALNSVRHNLEVARQCTKLITASSINPDRILSESEVRRRILDRLEEMRNDCNHDYPRYQDYYDNGKFGMPDITYISANGRFVSIEVVTANYSDEKSNQLEKTLFFLGVSKLEVVRI